MTKRNVAAVTTGNTVLNALAKGICPICSLVRAFQNELIENLQPDAASMICNYHAWAIAASAPASSVIEIFLAMLRGAKSPEVGEDRIDCDLCWSIREHEIARLKEFAGEMSRGRFAEWVANYGMLCRFHGAALRPMLSAEHAKIIEVVIEGNRQELEQMLRSYAVTIHNGGRSGGGILGRVAEFLVAQRGLTK